MNSLRARLLLATTLVLLAFVGLTGIALQRAFHERAEQAEQDKLQGLIYALLAAADSDDSGALTVSEEKLRDDRLMRPDSGLYALLLDETGRSLWQSPSLLDPFTLATLPPVAVTQFARRMGGNGSELFTLALTVRWASERDPRRYSFVVAESTAEFESQMQRFRRVLWLWLLVPATLLLALQLLILRWVLSPTRRLVTELHAIEAGRSDAIAGRYPEELTALTGALNAMLRSERNRQIRYRNALDDLAHSLKTPLAVLQGETDRAGIPAAQRERLREQVARMQQIVGYQLKKAAAAGTRTLTTPLAVQPRAEQVAAALAKVYRDKAVQYRIELPDGLRLRLDEGDLMELLGNLMDNASKWCRTGVWLTADAGGSPLQLHFDDDGPGFPAGEEQQLLQRGARADSRSEGQGIGLAVVAEIVRACGGELRLGRSPRGGARVSVLLPAA